jgi:outer membrane protein insertion porin family
VRAGFLWLYTNNEIVNGEKFRTGGSTTIRGFQHNTVVPLDVPPDDPDYKTNIFFGGNSVLILNEEFRFPIYKWFSGAAFFDAGNVYQNVSDFDPTNLRYSAGFGFRAGAAGFVVRFDWGFNLDRRENEPPHVFHFGIGQAF